MQEHAHPLHPVPRVVGPHLDVEEALPVGKPGDGELAPDAVDDVGQLAPRRRFVDADRADLPAALGEVDGDEAPVERRLVAVDGRVAALPGDALGVDEDALRPVPVGDREPGELRVGRDLRVEAVVAGEHAGGGERPAEAEGAQAGEELGPAGQSLELSRRVPAVRGQVGGELVAAALHPAIGIRHLGAEIVVDGIDRARGGGRVGDARGRGAGGQQDGGDERPHVR
ncbi:MAG TPA: hypothetical protein VKE22_07535 [Haliangiales bacterium]|nr:hypothetical protein [Haliangiales bacterium]